MSNLTKNVRDQFDWPLFVSVCALATIGIVNLYSATSAPGAVADMYIQQMYWLALGAGIATLVTLIDYRHFERYGWFIYAGGVVLLVLVLAFGEGIRGARRCRRTAFRGPTSTS